MAGLFARMFAKKAIQGNKRQRPEDPYYPYFEKGPGKKKVEIQPDPRLTKKEKKIRKKVRDRAYSLDMSLFRMPWIGNFGWSSVIGLIPGVGDMLDSFLAWWLIRTCNSVEPKLPSRVIWSMYGNLALDFLIGLVPVLGDLADAAYKCNTKNFVLLEKELKRRAEERQPQARYAAAGTGPSPPQNAYAPRGERGGPQIDLEAGNPYR